MWDTVLRSAFQTTSQQVTPSLIPLPRKALLFLVTHLSGWFFVLPLSVQRNTLSSESHNHRTELLELKHTDLQHFKNLNT